MTKKKKKSFVCKKNIYIVCRIPILSVRTEQKKIINSFSFEYTFCQRKYL